MRKTISTEELSHVLNLLSELAFNGFIDHGSNGLPRLVFDKTDFSKLKDRVLPGILIESFTLCFNSQNVSKVLYRPVPLGLL